MITLSASGGSVTFAFDGNSTYLNDGQITVPVNSLALIIDESDMATFRKAASNDIFVSANIAEFGMTKAELESWYKANMVGSTGGGGGVTHEEFEAYSAATDSRIGEDEEVTAAALNVINDRLAEDEEVTSAALNDLNEAVSGKQDTLSAGTNITIVDNVISAEGGGSTYTAGDGIDITNDVISVTGKVSTSDFNTYSGTVDTALNNKADTSAVTAVQDSLSGYVYTADNGKQDIFGKKTFIGQKRLNFTQAALSDKLGFTLYDVRDGLGNAKEYGALELNPSGITENSVTHPLLTLNHYRNNSGLNVQTYIGYRQYDQPHSAAYHLLAPLPENAKTPFNLTTTFQNYYFPLGFKNGSTMIKADNTGVVNLSSEFGGKVDTSAITTSVTSSSTDAQVPSAKAVNDKLGGLSLVQLTQAEYDALATKDNNTLYVIVG